MTGRFLSHDPAEGDSSNPPSLHRYLYAYQNPTVFVDPTGAVPEEFAEKFSEGLTEGLDRQSQRRREIFGTDLGASELQEEDDGETEEEPSLLERAVAFVGSLFRAKEVKEELDKEWEENQVETA